MIILILCRRYVYTSSTRCIRQLPVKSFVFDRIVSFIFIFLSTQPVRDAQEKWSWVQTENDKIQSLLALKTSGDEKFKAKNFKAALLSYSNAIKVGSLLCFVLFCCVQIYGNCVPLFFWSALHICFWLRFFHINFIVSCIVTPNRWMWVPANGMRSFSATALPLICLLVSHR